MPVRGPGGAHDGVFLDGTGVTPGTEHCRCTPECEFPCWQRLGWAPPCAACGCPQVVVVEHSPLFKEPRR